MCPVLLKKSSKNKDQEIPSGLGSIKALGTSTRAISME